MNLQLPLHTRAGALVASLATTAFIIITLAEMGHPPPDGRGAILSLLVPVPVPAARAGLALVTRETTGDVSTFEVPQP